MKLNLTILYLCITTVIFGQEKWTYQSDSIYKVNKVKARKWFNGDKLTVTTFYDKEGRMTKLQYEPFVGGSQRTIYFGYNHNGALVNQVDTTRNGKPDKKALKRFKKLGFKLPSESKDKPEIEVLNYKIEYESEKLLKRTKFNSDGTLNIVDRFENNGKKQIRDWYRKGKKYRESITEYIDDFHKKKFYGWEIRPRQGKREWNYTFEDYIIENGQVKAFTRFEDGVKKETTRMEYNDKGLLIKAIYYTTERFEYDYYQ